LDYGGFSNFAVGHNTVQQKVGDYNRLG